MSRNVTSYPREQIELEMVSICQLVPDYHLLRKVDATVDFSFIYKKVKNFYYQNNGRRPTKNHKKVITRHVWESSKEKAKENRPSTEGKIIYKRRKKAIERSFVDVKQLHRLRYCQLRGIKGALMNKRL